MKSTLTYDQKKKIALGFINDAEPVSENIDFINHNVKNILTKETKDLNKKSELSFQAQTSLLINDKKILSEDVELPIDDSDFDVAGYYPSITSKLSMVLTYDVILCYRIDVIDDEFGERKHCEYSLKDIDNIKLEKIDIINVSPLNEKDKQIFNLAFLKNFVKSQIEKELNQRYSLSNYIDFDLYGVEPI